MNTLWHHRYALQFWLGTFLLQQCLKGRLASMIKFMKLQIRNDRISLLTIKPCSLSITKALKPVSVTTTGSVWKPTMRATWALLFWPIWPASPVCKPTTFVVTEKGFNANGSWLFHQIKMCARNFITSRPFFNVLIKEFHSTLKPTQEK